jgi:hypothetical protein
MEMMPSVQEASDSANISVGRVLTIALLCGALTFCCLFSSLRGKPSTAPSSTAVALVTP